MVARGRGGRAAGVDGGKRGRTPARASSLSFSPAPAPPSRTPGGRGACPRRLEQAAPSSRPRAARAPPARARRPDRIWALAVSFPPRPRAPSPSLSSGWRARRAGAAGGHTRPAEIERARPRARAPPPDALPSLPHDQALLLHECCRPGRRCGRDGALRGVGGRFSGPHEGAAGAPRPPPPPRPHAAGACRAGCGPVRGRPETSARPQRPRARAGPTRPTPPTTRPCRPRTCPPPPSNAPSAARRAPRSGARGRTAPRPCATRAASSGCARCAARWLEGGSSKGAAAP